MKILFAAPHCLLDPSSGAAMSCRAILEGLAERGHEVVALGCTVFDRPRTASGQAFVEALKAVRIGEEGKAIWRLRYRRVRYLLTVAQAQRRMEMTAREEDLLFAALRSTVAEFKPDLVMTYGGQILDRYMRDWLARRGLPVVFYLANPSYHLPEHFRDVSRIVTDSRATATLYRERLGVEAVQIGKFVAPATVRGEGEHVTFINPSQPKGVGLFVAIAREAARRGLGTRFLVIESRGRLAPFLAKHDLGAEDLPNVIVRPMQTNMNRVWRATRLLLVPSLWHESGPRVAVEALSAGIPVLATDGGGTPEMLNGSGFLFPKPPGDKESWARIPPVETAAPWVDRIAALEQDAEALAAARAAADAAWRDHPLVNRIDLVERLFGEMLADRRATVG